jgi:molybdopterin-containing oxidoreductase family membrane subunit
MKILEFAAFSVRQLVVGNRWYYLWLAVLALLLGVGIAGVSQQVIHGHIVSNMRDPVPWGVFIGTYAFFVGVAAAAVALVVPGYIYGWKPIKQIVVLGEIISIGAVTMCILFVMADLGHPERFWHLLPIVGWPNLPSSMIAMNVLILNGYLVLNVIIVTYLLYCAFVGREFGGPLVTMLIIVSIPAAISIHATTAFIFNVLPSRPYWNTAILVPRFISTALVAGPALMIIAFEIVRKVANLKIIKFEALFRIADLMAHVMFVNLLLFIAEVVTEFRSATHHTLHIQYYFQGIHGHLTLVPWAWFGVACSLTAFTLFMIPKTRRNLVTMNIGCVLAFCGVFIEKGIGLVLPGLTPGTLGEIYEYTPALPEVMIMVGVTGAGMLVFTLLTKIAMPLVLVEAAEEREAEAEPEPVQRRWGYTAPPLRPVR